MRLRIAVAFLAALPIEALNLWVCPFPIDVGYPEGTRWYINLRGLIWVLPHLAGLRLYDWLGHHGLQGYFILVVFLSGFLSTTLLLLAAILGYRWIRRETRRYDASRSSAAIGNPSA